MNPQSNWRCWIIEMIFQPWLEKEIKIPDWYLFFDVQFVCV